MKQNSFATVSAPSVVYTPAFNEWKSKAELCNSRKSCNLALSSFQKLSLLQAFLQICPGAVQLKIKGPKAGYYIFQKHLFEL